MEENTLVQGGESAPESVVELESPTISDHVREAFEIESAKVEGEGDGVSRTTDRPQDRGDGRDPRGRFAGQPAGAPGAQFQQPLTAQAQAAPQFQPPPGWDQEARAAFAGLPPAVQQAVARREEEINRGFQVLQNYRGLERFAPYLQQNGSTYHDVMSRALNWEIATVRDPIGAAVHLLQLRGISPQLAAQAFLNPQLAAQIRAQNPHANGPRAPQPQPLNPDMVRQIASHEYHRADTYRRTNDEVSAFLRDPNYPHVGHLVDDMVLMINNGRARGLQDAYQLALRLHPEVTAVNRGSPQNAVNQARRAAKAAIGAPSGGHTPGGERPTSAKSVKSAARIAYEQQRGTI